MQSSSACVALITTTLINAFGVRLLAIINNIGVAAEILGMLVFALILLFFANHQPISVLFDTSYTSNLADGEYFAGLPRRRCSWPCSSSTASTPPGRSARRRSTPAGRRRAASSSAIWLSGIVGAIFLLAVTLSFQDMAAAVATGQAFGFPIADDDQGEPDVALGGITFGDALPVRDPRSRSTSARWRSRARPPA